MTLARHLQLLRSVFTDQPRSPPTRASIAVAIRDALDMHANSRAGQRTFALSKDEAQKLHMIWRRLWQCLKRCQMSRDYATNTLKACFDTAGAVAHKEESDQELQTCVVDSSQDEKPQPQPPAKRRRLSRKILCFCGFGRFTTTGS